MNPVMQLIEDQYTNKKIPDVKVGQTVEVDTIIRDGEKQRIQKFRGLVIAIKGVGASKTLTVRKVSYGVGVEKTLPVYSPNVGLIKILKEEPVRRAKLYFMRNRIGKGSMRVRKGRTTLVPQEGEAEDIIEVMQAEPVVAEAPVAEQTAEVAA